jgi:hypothetical protein
VKEDILIAALADLHECIRVAAVHEGIIAIVCVAITRVDMAWDINLVVF